MTDEDLNYYFNVEFNNALVTCGTETQTNLDINNKEFTKIDFIRIGEKNSVSNSDVIYRYINNTNKSLSKAKFDLNLTNSSNVFFAAYTIPSEAKGRKNNTTFYYRLGMDYSKVNFNPGFLINNPYLFELYNAINEVANNKAQIMESIKNSSWIKSLNGTEYENVQEQKFKESCIRNWIDNSRDNLIIAIKAIDILIKTRLKKTLVFNFSNEQNTNIIQKVLLLLPTSLAKRISFNTCMDPNDFESGSKYLLCGFSKKCNKEETLNKLKSDERFELYNDCELQNIYSKELYRNINNWSYNDITKEFDENISCDLISINLDCLMIDKTDNKWEFIDTIIKNYDNDSIKSVQSIIDDEIKNLLNNASYQSISQSIRFIDSKYTLNYINENSLLANFITCLLKIYNDDLNITKKKHIQNLISNTSCAKFENIATYNDNFSKEIINLLYQNLEKYNDDNTISKEETENDINLMQKFLPFIIFRFNKIEYQQSNEEIQTIYKIFAILANNYLVFIKLFKTIFNEDLIFKNSNYKYDYDYLKLLFRKENGTIFTEFSGTNRDIYPEIKDIITKSENKEINIKFYNYLLEQECETDWIEDFLVEDVISIDDIIFMSQKPKNMVPLKIFHKKVTKYLSRHLEEITINNFKDLEKVYRDFDTSNVDEDNDIMRIMNEFKYLQDKITNAYRIFEETEVKKSNMFDEILQTILDKEINKDIKKKEIVSDAKSVTRNHFITFIICYIISILLILLMIIPARKFWYCFSFFTFISGLVSLISFSKTKGFSIIDARKYSFISQLLMVIIPEIIVNVSLYLLYFLL